MINFNLLIIFSTLFGSQWVKFCLAWVSSMEVDPVQAGLSLWGQTGFSLWQKEASQPLQPSQPDAEVASYVMCSFPRIHWLFPADQIQVQI